MAANGEKQNDPFGGMSFLTEGSTESSGSPPVETKEKPKEAPEISRDKTISILTQQEEEDLLKEAEKKTEEVKDSEETIKKPPEAAKEEKKEEKKEDTSVEGEISPILLHAAALHERGVLPNIDIDELKKKYESEDFSDEDLVDEIIDGSEEEIEKGIKRGVESWTSDYKNQYSEEQLRIIDLVEKGIPFDIASGGVVDELRYNNVKEGELEENGELQESVYRESLKLKGFSSSGIDRKVSQAKEHEFLLDESKDALTDLKKHRREQNEIIEQQARDNEKETKKLEIEREKNNKKVLIDIKDKVYKIKEIIPGISVSRKEKDKLNTSMTIPVEYREFEGRKVPIDKITLMKEKDPISFVMRLNYYIDLGFFDDKPNFEKILKRGESTATKKLTETLKSDEHKGGKDTIVKEKREDEKDVLPTNYFPFIS